MGWSATGDDRAKSYKAYKVLEAKVAELEAELAKLRTDNETKDITIRTLAKELYRSTGTHVPVEAAEVQAAGEVAQDTPSGPTKRPSGTMPRVAPKSLAEAIPRVQETKPLWTGPAKSLEEAFGRAAGSRKPR